MKWFHKDATGLNADIDRHRAEEADLIARIEKLEGIANPTEMDLRALRVYRGFLSTLQQSKAEVVNKIGKKK